MTTGLRVVSVPHLEQGDRCRSTKSRTEPFTRFKSWGLSVAHSLRTDAEMKLLGILEEMKKVAWKFHARVKEGKEERERKRISSIPHHPGFLLLLLRLRPRRVCQRQLKRRQRAQASHRSSRDLPKMVLVMSTSMPMPSGSSGMSCDLRHFHSTHRLFE